MPRMTSPSLFFILLIAMVHQSRCRENQWEKFGINYDLACYKNAILQLFDNYKKIVEPSYVEPTEKEFKSFFTSRLKFSSFFNKGNETIEDLLKKRIKEANFVANKGLFNIHQWLSSRCTDENQKQIMEFTKMFKEAIGKCGNSKYRGGSMWWLERICPENEKKEITNDETTTKAEWGSQIHH